MHCWINKHKQWNIFKWITFPFILFVSKHLKYVQSRSILPSRRYQTHVSNIDHTWRQLQVVPKKWWHVYKRRWFIYIVNIKISKLPRTNMSPFFLGHPVLHIICLTNNEEASVVVSGPGYMYLVPGHNIGHVFSLQFWYLLNINQFCLSSPRQLKTCQILHFYRN